MRLILAIVIAAILLSSCKKLKEPEFRRIEHFNIKPTGLTSGIIKFDVTFYNPNSSGLNLKEAALDVFIDSIKLGQFTQRTDVAVNGNQEFSIPLEGSVTLRTLSDLDVFHMLGKEILLTANGNVRVGKGGIYINKAIHYQGKQVVDENLFK